LGQREHFPFTSDIADNPIIFDVASASCAWL